MKRLIFTISTLCLVLIFAGCSQRNEDQTTDEAKNMISEIEIAKSNEKMVHDTLIEAITNEYEDKIAQVAKKSTSDNEAITELTKKYTEEIEKLDASDAQIEKDIINLNNEYADLLAEATNASSSSEVAYASSAVFNFVASNEKNLDDYYKELDKLNKKQEENDKQRKALKEKYDNDYKELRKRIEEHEKAIADYQAQLNNKIATLTAEYNKKIADMDSIISSLKSITEENSERITELEALMEKLLTSTTHTVAFDTLGGTDVEAQSVLHGEKIAEPAAVPTLDGYTFKGWYLGNDKWSFIGYVVTEDITLTAKWVPTNYSYTLQESDGTEISVDTYNIESEAIQLPKPTKNGYEFIGWTSEKQINPVLDATIETGSTQDLVFTANWVPVRYTITYELSGGSFLGEYPTEYTIESDDIVIPSPTKDSTPFVGWSSNISITVSDNTIIPTGTFGNIILTANWEFKLIYPVDGEIIVFHDPNVPYFNQTLSEWRIHTGIDIASPIGTSVVAAEGGIVTKVYNHTSLGQTVEITHKNGLISVYSNLGSDVLVSVNDEVTKGTVIGYVGNSSVIESAGESHLHFAVFLNGREVDPLEYLMN